jgi:tetratricopeptide (TPR) repeat protein
LRLFLGLIYSLQGRVDEAERVIETSWNRLEQLGDAASETAILLVRLHIDLWREAPPIAEIRASLDQSAHAAQQDDRAMLGRAKLATRAGAYEEAGRLLAACLRQRPDDIAVWRAQLDWALATHRLEEVRKALTHLRVDGESPGTVERLKGSGRGAAGARAADRDPTRGFRCDRSPGGDRAKGGKVRAGRGTAGHEDEATQAQGAIQSPLRAEPDNP